jgi:hypothetical protein
VRSCLIDGEAACCDHDGIPAFERMRGRRHDQHVFLYRAPRAEVRKATLRSLLRGEWHR